MIEKLSDEMIKNEFIKRFKETGSFCDFCNRWEESAKFVRDYYDSQIEAQANNIKEMINDIEKAVDWEHCSGCAEILEIIKIKLLTLVFIDSTNSCANCRDKGMQMYLEKCKSCRSDLLGFVNWEKDSISIRSVK